MAYVQKLAARSVAHQLSTAGGAMLAGMDAATARALAAQASGLYCGGWAHVQFVWGFVCAGDWTVGGSRLTSAAFYRTSALQRI